MNAARDNAAVDPIPIPIPVEIAWRLIAGKVFGTHRRSEGGISARKKHCPWRTAMPRSNKEGANLIDDVMPGRWLTYPVSEGTPFVAYSNT